MKKRFLCKIGWHKYKQDKELHIKDIHPGFDSEWKCPTRKCIFCGYEERWLPGYGGSEIGCWLKKG